MRREMANLMQQITTHSEQSKVVKESETRVREEKRKVEQQLLVASADRVGVISWHVKSSILLHSTGLENICLFPGKLANFHTISYMFLGIKKKKKKEEKKKNPSKFRNFPPSTNISQE